MMEGKKRKIISQIKEITIKIDQYIKKRNRLLWDLERIENIEIEEMTKRVIENLE